MVTEEVVRDVATLAGLSLTDAEVAQMQADLGNILEHMAILKSVDTDGIEPMTQVFSAAGNDSLRADIVRTPLTNNETLQNASISGDGYFKVPRVIERGN